MLKAYSRVPLWGRILAALFLGLIVGLIVGPGIVVIKPIGTLFINAIKMIVVPLIFLSLVCGVMSLEPAKLGRIGGKTIGLYLCTTVVAVSFGLIVGLLIEPGVGLSLKAGAAPAVKAPPPVVDVFLAMVPTNPVDALARGDVLQIIVFAIVFGIAMTLAGERAAPLARVIQAGNDVILKLVGMVMELAPFGVFALIAWVTGTYGAAALLPLIKLIIAVYVACAIHAFVTLSGLVAILGRLSPMQYIKGIAEPGIVAFTTTSSNATLPVTMRVAETKLGISNAVASFSLPLGATVNMDGTAIYQGITALFVAQLFGIDLGAGQYIAIITSATLASIGTAGVPGAGLIMMSMVLGAVGLPLEGIAVVAGIDRILDMARTSVNVIGDLAVSLVVAKSEGELDLARYNSGSAAVEAPIIAASRKVSA